MDVGEGLQVVSGGLCARVGGGAKCGRWNPTAEQVKVLTDLFRAGLRTPSAEQIQTISSHLSSFGKIESKNVFYWFQNHKARERHQKKRRRGGAGEAFCMLTPSKREALNMMAGGQQVAWEPQEKEVETLELFPLKSYDSEVEEVTARMECKEIPGLDNGRDPPLDLRLSFL